MEISTWNTKTEKIDSRILFWSSLNVIETKFKVNENAWSKLSQERLEQLEKVAIGNSLSRLGLCQTKKLGKTDKKLGLCFQEDIEIKNIEEKKSEKHQFIEPPEIDVDVDFDEEDIKKKSGGHVYITITEGEGKGPSVFNFWDIVSIIRDDLFLQNFNNHTSKMIAENLMHRQTRYTFF